MVGVFAGLIFSGAYEPLGWWFLAPISFAILFKRLQKTAHPIRTVFLFALISQGLVLHWSGKYVGFIPWALLALLQSLFFLVPAFIFMRTRNIWLFIAALLVIDEMRARFPFGGFGWTRIAFSQADAPFIHLVAIGGVALLSLWVLLIAFLLTQIRIRNFFLLLLAIMIPLALSNPGHAKEGLNIAGIQGNTPKVGLSFNDRAQAVFELHLRQTYKINRKIDLIVWPENASDIDPYLTPGIKEKINTVMKAKGAPLLLGAVLRSSGKLENASILFSENSTKSTYIKKHLTPFGEYIPIRTLAEKVSSLAKTVTDFTPGKRYVVHTVKGIALGPIICYEIIDDELVREAAKRSSALIVQTNSATFAGTAESAQQLNITKIRAVEHNRDILSVSTIGLSALITNNGEIVEKTREEVPQTIYGKLHISNGQTLSDKLGGVGPILVILAPLLLSFRKRKIQ